MQPQSLTFSGPGPQTVTITWTLGNFEQSGITGWEQLNILDPNVLSNQATFTLNCPPG